MTTAAWVSTPERIAAPTPHSSSSYSVDRVFGRVLSAGSRRRRRPSFAERTSAGWSGRARLPRAIPWCPTRRRALCSCHGRRELVAHWLQEAGPDPEAYALLSWSKDGGRTWSLPVMPHHDATRTQHGFASLFQVPAAVLVSCGLTDATSPGAPEAYGAMALWAATYDLDGKQSPRCLVPRVCDCCQTSVANRRWRRCRA